MLALLAILGVIYKLVIAPRDLSPAKAFPAPRVTWTMLHGPPYALWAHRGRVVFLDFYASWCEPCKIETPLVQTYARLHPEVDVIPIDVGEDRVVVADFARRYHLPNAALDPQALSRGFFAVQGFPTMIVVDPKGMIRATWSGLNPTIQLAMSHAEATLKNSHHETKIK